MLARAWASATPSTYQGCLWVRHQAAHMSSALRSQYSVTSLGFNVLNLMVSVLQCLAACLNGRHLCKFAAYCSKACPARHTNFASHGVHSVSMCTQANMTDMWRNQLGWAGLHHFTLGGNVVTIFR